MTAKHKNILVLGLGNPVLGDDHIGILLVNDLQKFDHLRKNVHFQVSSQAGLYLLDLLIGFHQVIFIDAIVDVRARPGTVKVWPLNNQPSYILGSSPHYIGVSSMIAIGKQLNIEMPEDLWLIGITIKEKLQISEQLSNEIRKQYQQILKQVDKHLQKILSQKPQPQYAS